jgi:hypothetical protein
MSDDDRPKGRSESDAELEREIRKDRKFSLTEAIGRLAGPGSMKGASPIARRQQVETEIHACLTRHVNDAGSPLHTVLLRQIKASELLLNNFDQPLVILASYIRQVLGSDYLLKELVRATDVEWGRAFEERPHFEKEGHAPHADDPYTVESVRTCLSQLIEKLAAERSDS